MFEILAATRNRHKIEEFKKLLSEQGVDIIGLDDIEGAPDTVEDGKTFEENAQKKALEASNFAEMAAFADDSGLEVDALNGAPGIHSARYAGENATNDERIAKLLKELEGVENRNAKFVCALAIANDGEIIETFRGEVKGKIIDAPRGEHGFGYDPVFVPDGYDKTFAELGSEIKDKISHRARATRDAIDYIEDELSTIDDFTD
jgi:XTP/dITP diphosphohydrolase